MKKIFILISIIVISFILVGCGQEQSVEKTTPKTTTEPITTPSTEKSPEGSVVKTFSIIARQWEFEPSEIHVKKGDVVRLTITSRDVMHGYSIPAFGINEVLNPGIPVEVSFVADKVGTFTTTCSVPCGQGHGGMTGTLVVTE